LGNDADAPYKRLEFLFGKTDPVISDLEARQVIEVTAFITKKLYRPDKEEGAGKNSKGLGKKELQQ